MTVFSHPEFNSHQQVAFQQNVKSGLKAIIAIHNTNLGPALGGCRMWPYASDEEALRDVLRLSRSMTYKSALANIRLGGGKAVIIGDPETQKTDALLHAMGDFIDSLGGRYITAEDSGTQVADIATMGERTPHISGVVKDCEHGGDPSPATARGVFVGLKSAVNYRLGGSNINGLKVAIQGVGNVGFRLAKLLKEVGAEVFVSDLLPRNVRRAVSQLGVVAVNTDAIVGLDVDVFAPCAMGAVINDDTLDQLKAPVIAGAANNQLAGKRHGELLHQREILYAPDYAVNAGGIIGIYYQRSGGGAEALQAHIDTIADTLAEIFERAQCDNVPTSVVADALAEERFAI